MTINQELVSCVPSQMKAGDRSGECDCARSGQYTLTGVTLAEDNQALVKLRIVKRLTKCEQNEERILEVPVSLRATDDCEGVE